MVARILAAWCLVVAVLLAANPARAGQMADFSDLTPEERACLLEYLDQGQLDQLALGRPDSKSLRKKAKEAAASCLCPEAPAPYDGPLFDAMAQLDGAMSEMRAYVDSARQAGVQCMALFARLIKGNMAMEGRVLDLAGEYPDFLVLGAPKSFELRGDLTGSFVRDTLAGLDEHDYRFIGEVLYSHADKKGGEVTPKGERFVDPAREGTAELLRGLAGKDVPLMTHWEVYEWERDWAAFDALYSAWPDQIFILPHMGFASVEQVREMLAAHPNLYMIISKKDDFPRFFMDQAKLDRLGSPFLNSCGVLDPAWRAVLVDYQDRLLAATDAHSHSRWDDYAVHAASLRTVLGQLPSDAARKIAYGNACRLYGVDPASLEQ